MAELTERPFPPGIYPLVVVGSGPGALQLTYSLRALGIEHAVISQDDAPGGMFRKWPIFQRMLSWTKPYADHQRGTPAYQRY
ncbi:MAG TPA: FAD/NAD(P)-binding oxidoreductase, partial [bacterium]|nr:FAD/NAD(P)-binding oxidoreductase [bacterium]